MVGASDSGVQLQSMVLGTAVSHSVYVGGSEKGMMLIHITLYLIPCTKQPSCILTSQSSTFWALFSEKCLPVCKILPFEALPFVDCCWIVTVSECSQSVFSTLAEIDVWTAKSLLVSLVADNLWAAE